MHEVIDSQAHNEGEVALGYVPDGCQQHPQLWVPQTPFTHNDTLRSFATAVQRLLRNVRDGKNYYIGGMYIEFDNSGDAVDPVPTIDRSSGLEYYTALASPRDYLRVPLSATAEEISDEDLFAEANRAIYWAQTAGSVGMNGLTFSDGAGSRVYGGALVVFRDPDDASQDIIHSRFYKSSAQQLEKLAGSQIAMIWRQTWK